MSISDRMNIQSLARAQEQVQNVCASGISIELIKPLTKDKLGGTLTETVLTFKSFPIRYTPFDRKTFEKISWAEEVEVITYISKKAFADAGHDLNRIKKQYTSIRINGKTYGLRFVDYYSAFGTDFLYIVFGGKN